MLIEILEVDYSVKKSFQCLLSFSPFIVDFLLDFTNILFPLLEVGSQLILLVGIIIEVIL